MPAPPLAHGDQVRPRWMTVLQATMAGGSLLRRMAGAKSSGFLIVRTMAVQVIVLGLNLVTGVLAARLLGPEGRGVFAAATIWPQLLLATSFLGMPAAIVYFVRGNKDAAGGIFAASLIIGTVFYGLTILVGLALAPWMMRNYSAEAIILAQFCVIATGPYILSLLLRQLFVALGSFTAFNLAVCLQPTLYLIGLLAALAAGGVTVEAAAVCLMASVVLSVVLMGWHAARICRPTTRELRKWLGALTSYSTRGAVADFLSGITAYSDRLILIVFISPAELGLYAVAFSLSRLMLVLQTVVNSIVFPAMAGRDARDVKVLHDHALRFTTYAVVAAVLVVLLVGRTVVVMLYGHSFNEAVVILHILVVEAGLACISGVTSQLYYALGVPGYVSWAQTASFVGVVGGLILLVPTFGAVGAAWAMVLAGAIRLAVLLCGLPLSLKLELPRLSPRSSDLRYLRRMFAV